VNILNDFFYLSWESEPLCAIEPIWEDGEFLSLLSNQYERFCDASAILLSLSEVTLERFMALEETGEVLAYFAQEKRRHWERPMIYALQCRLFSFLIYQGDLSLNKSIGKRLDLLRKEGIIGYDTSRKLISLLTLIQERKRTESKMIAEPKAKQAGKADSYYTAAVQRLHEQMDTVSDAIEVPSLQQQLRRIPDKLSAQRFSIGITGVMNAGKSTMLNALLGAEILGTAVVPETANLTIIKYAKKPKAIVHFWRQDEWRRIEKSAGVLAQMQDVVEETRQHFGKRLEQYITEEGRSETVSIETLPSYTSAEHSDKRCNLVKEVELYQDLEFVREGVEIVDTPGLDDPVIQREEITKAYLQGCDMMCHLMHAGQSATQKDIAFILETLLYRNVAQLLIVITRIDMVTEEELAEVIAYTKSSIEARLKELGKGAQFASILERIQFIPVAGKMALLHRTGRAKEAIEAGYDLARSGILEIESYLREVLFGANSQKARLIVASANKELLHLIQAQLESYTQEQILLGKSAEEISELSAQYREEIAETKVQLQKLEQMVNRSRETLREHFEILDRQALHTLQSLQELLARRIMDDIRYTLKKEKRKPTPERIEAMIERGLQDGAIDLVRNYRHGFQKRLEELMERLAEAFGAFRVQQKATEYDTRGFVQKHFGTLEIFHSSTLLVAQVNRAIARYGKRELEQLASDIALSLSETMTEAQRRFMAYASTLQQVLLEEFEQQASAPLRQVKYEIAQRESLLEEARCRAEDSAYDTQARALLLERRIKQLHTLQTEILEGGVL